MALKLRRGLEIERFDPVAQTGPVFEEGEIIYVTDTKEVYVGDGVTPGGIRVTGNIEGSPPALTRDLDLAGYNIAGAGTITAGDGFIGDGSQLTNLPIPYDAIADKFSASTMEATSFIGDGSQLTGISAGAGVEEGQSYRIDIVGLDSSLMVDSFNLRFNGTFFGSGEGLTNLPAGAIDLTNSVQRINLEGSNGDQLLDVASNTFYGNFVGNGSGLSNLPLPNLDFATFQMNITGFDSTILVNTATNTITGNFVGDGSQLTGLPGSDLTDTSQQISILSDDESTILVNHATGVHFGTFVGDGSQLTGIDAGINEGQNYNIGLLNNLGQTSFDPGTSLFTGQFAGNGSQLTNLPLPNLDFTEWKLNIIGGDSSVIVNSATNTFTGTFNGQFVGDGSQITGINITDADLENRAIVNFNIISGLDGSTAIVNSATETFNGNFNGNHFGIFSGDGSQLVNLPQPNYDEIINQNSWQIDIVGADSSILVDSATGTFEGTFVGEFYGTIYSFDSSVVYDPTTNKIVIAELETPMIRSLLNNLLIEPLNPGNSDIKVISENGLSGLKLTRYSAGDLSADPDSHGGIFFERSDDINGNLTTGKIQGSNDFIYLAVDPTGSFADISNFVIFRNGNFGIGVGSPTSTLEVAGDGLFSGDVAASAFIGSVMADDSTTMINAIDQTVFSNLLTLAPLDAEPPSPTVGMIAVADFTNWDPLSTTLSRPYVVFYDGAGWQAMSPI